MERKNVLTLQLQENDQYSTWGVAIKHERQLYDVVSCWSHREFVTQILPGLFPTLATLARQLLAIPACSAASERSFSASGSTITARRSLLASDTVDNVLFLY